MKRITKSISAIFIGAVFFVSCATASGAAEKAKQSAAAKNEADEILLAEQGMLAYNWNRVNIVRSRIRRSMRQKRHSMRRAPRTV